MKNTPQTTNFRKCTPRTNFTACPIILLLLGTAIIPSLMPCIPGSVSLSLFSSPATSAKPTFSFLHFLPTVFKPLPVFDHLCGPFLVCPLWVGMTQTMSPVHYIWIDGFQMVWLSPVLSPAPFLVFFSILLGFVIVTLLTVELVIARPTQASFLRNR